MSSEQQFQQASLQLAQSLGAYGGVNPERIVQEGIATISADPNACSDGMLLRSGFCKRSGGSKRRKMKGGACTQSLSKVITVTLIVGEITGGGALLYMAAPAEISSLIMACHTAVITHVKGIIAGLLAAVQTKNYDILEKIWAICCSLWGAKKVLSVAADSVSSSLGGQFDQICNVVESWLSTPQAQGPIKAAGFPSYVQLYPGSANGGARRRRTYKKRGGARRGGARRGGARGSSCGMSGGRKRKSRRGRKSRGRKSRGRKSRVHKKRRGRKSKKH